MPLFKVGCSADIANHPWDVTIRILNTYDRTVWTIQRSNSGLPRSMKQDLRHFSDCKDFISTRSLRKALLMIDLLIIFYWHTYITLLL